MISTESLQKFSDRIDVVQNIVTILLLGPRRPFPIEMFEYFFESKKVGSVHH